MISMTSLSSEGPLSASSKRHFSDLVQMFLVSKLGTFNYVDHISYSFLNCNPFPRKTYHEISEKKNNFLSRLVAVFFFFCLFVLQCLFVWVLFVRGVACQTQT